MRDGLAHRLQDCDVRFQLLLRTVVKVILGRLRSKLPVTVSSKPSDIFTGVVTPRHFRRDDVSKMRSGYL